MIVTCPNCSTRFNLPDEQTKPGAKLRCSVCKHIFALPASDEDDSLDLASLSGSSSMSLDFESAGEQAKPKKSKKRKILAIFLAVLLMLGGAGAGVWYLAPDLITAYIPGLKAEPVPDVPAQDLISRIALSDVRQYPVNNEKTGPVTVIEGKVVNGFGDPRELIRVEAALYDKDGRVLISKQQLAGNAVSLFQLQVLGEQELEQALANKLGVLTYNTNVVPGGEVPFMIVFYKPPENAAEYGVKVVDARIAPAAN